MPKEKIICSLGSYGYDWTTTLPPPEPTGKHDAKKKPVPLKTLGQIPLSTQDAWQDAADSESQIDLDDDSLNAHFAYDDDDAHVRHQVWFLDAVTILNQMRGARTLGHSDLCSVELGSEDNSMWKIWDHPLTSDPVKELAQVEPGYDVDTEGEGDILRVTRKPQNGRRIVTMDDDDSVPLDYRMITAGVDGRPTRSPTRSSSTATIPRRSRSASTTAPTPNGRRRSSTS